MKKLLVSLLSGIILGLSAEAETVERHILLDEYVKPEVMDSFIPGKRWLPVPEYRDRAAWDALLSTDDRNALIEAGEKYLDYKWEVISATAKLDFERHSSRTRENGISANNLTALRSMLLAELAEGKGRFLDQLIDGCWFYAFQPGWAIGGHSIRQRSGRALCDPDDRLIDLVAGRVSAILSTAVYFLEEEFDKADPVIARSIRRSVNENIFLPYLDGDKDLEHWWLGDNLHRLHGTDKVINNWNTDCNLNVLYSFLLLEKDERTLNAAMLKGLTSLDRFLNYVRQDGACEEGAGYWYGSAGRMYDCLYLLKTASGGKFDVFSEPLIRKMATYASRAYIGGNDYLVNYADCQTRKRPAAPIYDMAIDLDEEELLSLAMSALIRNGRAALPSPDTNCCLRALRMLSRMKYYHADVDSLNARIASEGEDSVRKTLLERIPARTWYPESQVCMVRTSGGLFFSAKGGHNNESHNHNDLGHFILYADNAPLIVDPGAPVYTSKTFSSERYTIWEMQSGWHNTPVINGTEQEAGEEYTAREASFKETAGGCIFSLDIAGAYPKPAHCDSWKRTFTLSKNSMTINDRFSLSGRSGADSEHFIINGEARVAKPGVIIITNGTSSFRMTYPKSLCPGIEKKMMEDSEEKKNWGESLTRIRLNGAGDSPLKGSYEIRIERE